MRDKLSLNTLHKSFPLRISSVNMTKSAENCVVIVTLNRHYCTYSTGPTYKIFVRIFSVLIVATLFLLNGLFYYHLVMCKYMRTTVRLNRTDQFTFFLIIRLNVTIITSYDSLIVILVT